MLRALEDVFPDVEAAVDDDGRKRWRVRGEVLAPDRLRRLCEHFQRSDFPALP